MNRQSRVAAGLRRRGSPTLLASALLAVLPAFVAFAETPDPEISQQVQEAILAGDDDGLRGLVEEGASVDEAMVAAARVDRIEILEYLLTAGADPESFSGARALAVAILVEAREAESLLRANGAHLEARDDAGRTLLVWSSGRKRLGSLVRVAIDAGADLEAASRTGENALMTASRFGRIGSARMLLRAGASVDARDRDGWTPLMFAIRSSSNKIVSLLLQAGADPEAESTLGWTPLMLATWEGKLRIVNQLLRRGADPDQSTAMTHPPLVWAIQRGQVSVVKRLLAHQADPGSGEAGDAIWWAEKLRRTRMAKLLYAAARGER